MSLLSEIYRLNEAKELKVGNWVYYKNPPREGWAFVYDVKNSQIFTIGYNSAIEDKGRCGDTQGFIYKKDKDKAAIKGFKKINKIRVPKHIKSHVKKQLVGKPASKMI